MNRKRVIVRHSIASVIALALFGGSRFLYNVIISRKFGVEVLGEINSLISQAFFLAGFLAFFSIGVGKYTAEFLGRGEKNRIKSIAGISFLSPLLGLVLMPINFSLALLSILRAIQLTFRSFIYGLHRGEVYAYSIMLGFTLFLLGFLGDPLLPYYLFLATISVFGVVYLSREKLIGKPRINDFILLAKYSVWAFLGSASGIFLIQGPYFLTDILSGSESAGIVSAILSTAFLLSYLPQVVQSAIVPIFAYDYGKGSMETSKRLAEVSVEMLSIATAIIVFAILAFQPIIERIFRLKLGTLLLPALIGVEIYVSYNPLINLLSATKFIRSSSIYAISGSIVSLISWLLLIPKHGALGTLIGLIMGYSTIFALTLAKTVKEFGVKPRITVPLFLAIILQLLSKFISPIILVIAYLIIEWRKIRLFLHDIRSL
ncbi:lipopolysaccharide biosynthesis protein [Pyrococcus horikoshii]|nr:hypothetical protein [Pyrococcus horikoshii]HII61936.1 hypothetical protein [Pyrococcus horikoshii]